MRRPIFGNPKGGTALMQDRQTAGYNDARGIADRHSLGSASEANVAAIGDSLTRLARATSIG